MFISERLIIRPFVQSDFSDVFSYVSQEKVMHYIPEGTMSEDATKQFINKNLLPTANYLAVELSSEQKVIGHIFFAKWFGEHTYEIGWVFNPNYCQQGYATEAARCILENKFKNPILHRVIATCQPENHSSYHVMEKLHMRREAHFKQCIPYKDIWWDEYSYAILRDEWIAKTMK